MKDKLDRWIAEKIQGSSTPKKVEVAANPNRRNKRRKHFDRRQSFSKNKPSINKPSKVRIIPLGGLDEVGKNMMVIEYGRDIIVIDMGFQFPEEDMLGIDYVIPDISWLEERKQDIKGVILTHGHLDHIGGIPYILPRLNFPKLYGTKLTMGLIEKRVEEFGIKKETVMNIINPDETLRLGPFTCNFFRVNHSIPDGVGIIIDTPEGKIVHTGDFKFDYTPADQIQTDYEKLATLGRERKVSVLFSDSTNATREGHTISEKTIGETLDMIIRDTPGRIIIASFASLIGRLQQILDSAHRWERQVYISGRSLVDNIAIAERLGYIKVPKGLIHDIRKAEKSPGKKSLILTTGSQGEGMSALTRISLGDHKNVRIKKGDTVVISATPIVGNERAIFTVIDNLTKLGARIIHNKIMDVHTSGHGSKEDLKMMLDMVKPNQFVPVHGQYHMRFAHGEIAQATGVKEADVFMMNNGDILELKNGKATLSKEKVETNYILVDGLGMGNIGSQVLLERQAMAENGVFIVTLKIRKKTRQLAEPPRIETRGFIYMTESEEILKEIKAQIKDKYVVLMKKHSKLGVRNIQDYVTSVIDKYTHRKLQRRPLIVPIVIEI